LAFVSARVLFLQTPPDATTASNLSGDALADFGCSARFESSIFSFPDGPGSGLRFEIDAIQLFDDVLDFMSDELDRIVEPFEVDVHGHEHAIAVFHVDPRLM